MKMKKISSDFVLPAYGDNCFSNIPSTILNLFGIENNKPTVSRDYFERYTGKHYKNVVLFLIDALGFNQWKKYANHFPLFRQLDKGGYLNSITSIFPSTTAAALNTISSGLTPAEHGLFEWFLYLKEIDKTIETLPFKELGSEKRDSLLDEKVSPKVLFSNSTIYRLLKSHGVNSFSFVNKAYADSAYSKVSREGSNNITFTNFSDLVVKLRSQLLESNGRNYCFIYWDKLDSLSHEYGPSNDAYRVELSKISHLFLTELVEKIDKKTKSETLLIITADHGQIDVNWEKTIYLNKDNLLMKALQKDKKGNLILPTGGPRGVFLHIRESEIETLQKHLEDRLKNEADVIRTEEAISLNLFGKNKIRGKFRNRLGNLLLLARKNYMIWREYENKELKFLGHHGGLSKEEMLIPFSVCKLSELT